MFEQLIDFLISVLRIFQFWVVIYPYEKGIHLRLGKHVGDLDHGFHWCLPFKIDRVISVTTVVKTLRLGAQSLLTGDGKPVIINTVITCQVSDAAKCVLEVHSVDHVLDATCSGLVAAFVSGNDFSYIVECCAEPDTDLLSDCKEAADQYGVDIIGIQFTDVSQSRTIRLVNTTAEAASHWERESAGTDKL